MRRLFAVATSVATIGWALLLSGGSANAHFLWLDTRTSSDGTHLARLIFSESPTPGGRDLSAKVSQSKLWSRTTKGEISDLKFEPGTEADAKTLVATIAAQQGVCVEASCDYGVYSRGAQSVLLHYYAKTLPADWQQCGKDFARSQRLELDVVPHCGDRTIMLDVLLGKEKAVGKEVVVISPSGESRTLETNSQGRAIYRGAEPGKYAVRAAHIEASRSGECDGKKYGQTWTYSTATFEVVSAAGTAKATADVVKSDAAKALASARAARSVWAENFPGFAADASVNVAGEKATGKLKIDASGSVTLTMPDSRAADWAREQLESMVQHRMPDGQVSEGNVEFATDEGPNPMGRKIILNDGSNHSSYRIKDNVIMEVCRQAGPQMRFTISVLEVQWNAEKKYLPRSFVMNFFDIKTGALNESDAYSNLWQRVGEFDLPSRIVEVATEKGVADVRQLDLSHIELLDSKTQTASKQP